MNFNEITYAMDAIFFFLTNNIYVFSLNHREFTIFLNWLFFFLFFNETFCSHERKKKRRKRFYFWVWGVGRETDALDISLEVFCYWSRKFGNVFLSSSVLCCFLLGYYYYFFFFMYEKYIFSLFDINRRIVFCFY